MAQKIAVFRMSALGDCVLVLAAIRQLQALRPHDEIYWIIEANLLPLFRDVDGIHFIAIKKPRSLRDYLALRKQLASYRFDVLLAMQASLRSNLIYPLIRATRKIGFDKTRGRELHGFFIHERIAFAQEHLLDGFRRFAQCLSPQSKIEAAFPQWRLPVSASAIQWLEQHLRQMKAAQTLIVINPAASKPERCCTAAFYVQLIQALPQEYRVVLSGGPAQWEQSLASDIVAALDEASASKVLNLVGQSSLEQLAALLARADVVIAPDTGPIHLADALGSRVIGLYAVAPPGLTGPYQNQQLVIDKYPQALKKFLGKDLSKVSWGTRVHHRDAMSLFRVEEVLVMLDKALS